jgi:hypothetical protein
VDTALAVGEGLLAFWLGVLTGAVWLHTRHRHGD